MNSFISIIMSIAMLFMNTAGLCTQYIDQYNAVKNDTAGVYGYGRLYIPSVNVSVSLYETVYGDGRGQDLVDGWDSAAYRISHLGGAGFIGDHWNQGFDNIKKCKVGDFCFIKRKNGEILTYRCVKTIDGTSDGDDLYTEDGERLSKIKWADFACYTCNGHWTIVYLVFFKRVG